MIGKFIDGSPDSEARAEEALPTARSRSTRACRSRTSSTRTSRPTSVRRERALVRLLGEATRHGNDPELFAGLVHACRYCGLFEQSIAAHAEARRLDPNVPTSLEQTLLMTGDIERLLAVEPPPVDRRRRRWASGSSAWAWRDVATRRGSGCVEMRQALAHSGVPDVDGLSDGLARSPCRGHACRRRPLSAR